MLQLRFLDIRGRGAKMYEDKLEDTPKFNTNSKSVTKYFEGQLNGFAQKSEYSSRLYPIYRDTIRSEFQRDRDRILHSKSFRRLMHKTQVFAIENDHYRTRLTHTLEVLQISTQIAKILGVNSELVEAIALGHDLGHTPFGHVGERVLDNILNGTDNLDKKVNHEENLGGFKHNYQSLRIIDNNTKVYSDEPGLNLTWQVREGIWKHSKIYTENNNFYPDFEYEGLYPEYDHSVTIEGQIVCQADEIAQCAHDLDDGLRSGEITLNDIYSTYGYAFELFGEKDATFLNNNDDINRQKIINCVISYFVNNLFTHSIQLIENYWNSNENKKHFRAHHIIKDRLLVFSDHTQEMFDELKEIIESRIINSDTVNASDGKATYILRKIIKAYITNPRQLNRKTIQTCYERIKSNGLPCKDLTKCKQDEVVKEIFELQANFEKLPDGEDYKKPSKRYDILKKHSIFLRTIADHVAGMTDYYANKEYRKLYIPETY